jgi:hypothetical protein
MSLISTMKIKMIDKNIKNEDKNEHISMARKEKPTIYVVLIILLLETFLASVEYIESSQIIRCF